MQSTDNDRGQSDDALDQGLKVRYADLPLVSVLEKTVMEEARQALEELDDLQQLIEGYAKRQDELKKVLGRIQAAAGTEGLRWGQFVFREETRGGRTTLVAAKLMEVAGVTPEQLAECTVTGKPFVQRTFRNLGKGGGVG
jgi:hypothetical protein